MKPRVLVVDDSAFARTVLSRVLRESGQIEVIGTAREGGDALEQIAALDPDVITLDLTMPNIDGLGVLRALAGRPRPRAIVVSISSIATELGIEALALGAVALVAKPTALANDRLLEITDELVRTIIALAPVRAPAIVAAPAPSTRPSARIELVMIGTSTGGPQALTRVIGSLPADLACPVAVVLHIPVGYTEALAARLDKASRLKVIEAFPGVVLEPGMVAIARAGQHLHVRRQGTRLVADLASGPARDFMPSVDELFLSGAAALGSRTLGVVLTGMGDDGLEGSRAIAAAGGQLVVEAPETCVVYGMPRSVYEAGLGAVAHPLGQIADEIAKRV